MGIKQPCQRRPESLKNSEEFPGFPPEIGPDGQLPGAAAGRPLSLAWITDELLAHTREVWSRAYGRPVSEDEAIEMLLNVKRLAETLLKITRAEGGDDEGSDMGASVIP